MKQTIGKVFLGEKSIQFQTQYFLAANKNKKKHTEICVQLKGIVCNYPE